MTEQPVVQNSAILIQNPECLIHGINEYHEMRDLYASP